MNVYVARQPIFDKSRNIVAYELLYRNSQSNRYDHTVDGSVATSKVISNAISTFGLEKLTCNKPAYINFTRELLLNDYALMLEPQSIVIELLEDIAIDKPIINKLKYLHHQGYTLAIDDYDGTKDYSAIFAYIDIIKVDFKTTTPQKRVWLAKDLLPLGKKLLAEKIETNGDFALSAACGYDLFQGYYFAEPLVLSKKCADFSYTSCSKILCETAAPHPDFDKIAQIIEIDAAMTYRLFKQVNSLPSCHRAQIKDVKTALHCLGVPGIRKWIALMLLSTSGNKNSSQAIKAALARGEFCEKLVHRHRLPFVPSESFVAGMYSLIDVIVGDNLHEILDELPLPRVIKSALLGDNNKYRSLINFACAYEAGNWSGCQKFVSAYRLDINNICECYLDALLYADEMFGYD